MEVNIIEAMAMVIIIRVVDGYGYRVDNTSNTDIFIGLGM